MKEAEVQNMARTGLYLIIAVFVLIFIVFYLKDKNNALIETVALMEVCIEDLRAGEIEPLSCDETTPFD